MDRNIPSETLLWTFTGLSGVDLGGEREVALPCEFLISEKTSQLSAVLHTGYLGKMQAIYWAKAVDSFFCLRRSSPLPLSQEAELFQDGLTALQITKPVQNLGVIFQATGFHGGSLTVESVQERPQMFAGVWAQMPPFDAKLITQLQDFLPKVMARMKDGSVEERNSINLLQLSLEHFHPLIKCLLSVVGLDALLDSKDRNDFKMKLCGRLGEVAQVFPDWNSPSTSPPKYSVADIAVHLYTLRSKIAHGVDLRKALHDKNAPVDLAKWIEPIEDMGMMSYAELLSEAAIYILCALLQEELAQITSTSS